MEVGSATSPCGDRCRNECGFRTVTSPTPAFATMTSAGGDLADAARSSYGGGAATDGLLGATAQPVGATPPRDRFWPWGLDCGQTASMPLPVRECTPHAHGATGA